jgi:hypothetical protein
MTVQEFVNIDKDLQTIGFTTFVSENLWWMVVAEFGSITGYF